MAGLIDGFEHRTETRSIWVCAALLAIGLHAALGLFAIAHLSEAEAVDLGAPGIKIGIELASPRTPAVDLPPGPDSEASMATPPVQQQQQEVKQTELPKEVPIQTEEPDRLVTENTPEKPKEKEEEVVQAQPSPPSEASVAQEATAMPSIEEVPEAPKSVTRDPGTGQSKQRVRATWQRELVAHLDRHKRYPSDRVQKNANLLVNLVLDRTGKVIGASIVKGSGTASLMKQRLR